MKYLILASLLLTGCAADPVSGHVSASNYSQPTYVRSATGETQFKIQDGNIYRPNGTRVARIDSTGNVFNTSGVRVGRIGKK